MPLGRKTGMSDLWFGRPEKVLSVTLGNGMSASFRNPDGEMAETENIARAPFYED
jgi:hypothetical protein